MLGLSDKVRTILLTPHRTVKVGIAIEGEDGELQSYEGPPVPKDPLEAEYCDAGKAGNRAI